MGKIRILVVDDSVVVRRMVSDVLSSDPHMEVAGVAANGRIALAKIEQSNPDIATLDLEMPDMHGLEVLREIRRRRPDLPVIIFSTLSERGAAITLEALALGANDYVTKPANVGGVVQAIECLKTELIPRIRALCQPHRAAVLPVEPSPSGRMAAPRPVFFEGKPKAVVIGVSTGGPGALTQVLPQLEETLPVPILIVQHMPELFTRFLSERLNHICRMNVHEALDGMIAESGNIFIAPGGWHMLINWEPPHFVLRINREAPRNSCRPSVDLLFESAAEAYGSGLLGVVLTGMGYDGLKGAEKIREKGGYILTQDRESSVVWGMPGVVTEAGLANKVVPLDQVATEIKRLVTMGFRSPMPVGTP
ncbi:MAG: chemotaxis response regulator protein-glutamate methylesterase [Verrucomicrobiae bacterium]|nr:chemotaxis response regulator protein-glutamate methylesterase [Verrucomicrobiae bacterium]